MSGHTPSYYIFFTSYRKQDQGKPSSHTCCRLCTKFPPKVVKSSEVKPLRPMSDCEAIDNLERKSCLSPFHDFQKGSDQYDASPIVVVLLLQHAVVIVRSYKYRMIRILGAASRIFRSDRRNDDQSPGICARETTKPRAEACK